MTTYLGVDPDTKATGICLLYDDATGRRFYFSTAKAKGKSAHGRAPEMADALVVAAEDLHVYADQLAVEWMHLRPVEVNPNSVLAVQAVAGMALAAFASKVANVYLPTPREWRGCLPKPEMHKRFLKEADDLGFEGDRPETSHELDALGLCLWLRRGRVLRA
ncbi:MAG: hypothetical protein ACRDP6_38330 [Actinoallomurus sp.]